MSLNWYTDAATVPVRAGRPLLAVDADEVLLAFARGFDRFLDARGLYLDLVSYRLHGNVRRREDGTAILDIEVTGLLDEFRKELDWLESIEGAAKAIAALQQDMDAVVVSNVPAVQAPARLRNLTARGFFLPLLANTGPKGPAVNTLAKRAGAPIIFIDDIPMHHASVAECAPQVFRIHFVGDERLAPLMPQSPHVHARAHNWIDAEALIRARMRDT